MSTVHCLAAGLALTLWTLNVGADATIAARPATLPSRRGSEALLLLLLLLLDLLPRLLCCAAWLTHSCRAAA